MSWSRLAVTLRSRVLLGVRHIAVAVNKMDLVNYSKADFDAVRTDFIEIARPRDRRRHGDTRVRACRRQRRRPLAQMPWYEGQTLRVPKPCPLDWTHGNFPSGFPVQYRTDRAQPLIPTSEDSMPRIASG